MSRALGPSRRKEDPLEKLVFDQQIELGYRLKIYDTEIAEALDLVRKLRNDFAHKLSAEKLSNSPYAGWVGTLKSRASKIEIFNWVPFVGTGSEIDDFKRSATALVWELRRPLLEGDEEAQREFIEALRTAKSGGFLPLPSGTTIDDHLTLDRDEE